MANVSIATLSEQLVQTRSLLELVEAFHGDNPFEIRVIPEKGSLGRVLSFVKCGDKLYMDKVNGKKQEYSIYTPEKFNDLLMLFYTWNDYGVPCFTINSPNFDEMNTCFTKNQHIVQGGKVNCHHTEIDAPKEICGDRTAVRDFKKTLAQKILAFPLPPSIVVESKHGYHLYWLLSDGQPEFYNYIQMQLVQYFSGDENCINVARVMRLPWFMHMKDPTDPFPVQVRWWHPERRYIQEDLKHALPELEQETAKRVLKVHHKPVDGDSDKPQLYDDERKQRIMNAVSNKFEIVSSTHDKWVMHCCLPDHQDDHPSAWFDSEYMWFHCAGCGHSYPIDLLAEELGWEDVLVEINRYDLDVGAEFERIKSLLVDVNDVLGGNLDEFGTQLIDDVTESVIVRLHEKGQVLTEKHKHYIRNIAHVLWKADLNNDTFLIPLDMGGGKSTIILVFLEEVFTFFSEFGAIVAVERREDARALQASLNEAVGEPVALAMLGFDKEECELNVRRGRNYERCVERSNHKHEKCPFKDKCQFYRQFDDNKSRPVLIVTHKRMADNIHQLSKEFGSFKSRDGSKKNRELLIIDEKPFINRVHELDMKWFKTQSSRITKALGRMKNDIVLAEWKKAVTDIGTLMVAGESRERFNAIRRTFRFSNGFWKCFHSLFSYTDTIYSLPQIMECVMRNGGHKTTNKEGRVKLFTAQFQDYSKIKGFKTVVFDGTADIDIDYNHKDFNVLKFDPLRTYEGLEIYQCHLFSGFKTSMSDSDRIKAFCSDVIAIANENPTSKIFFPVFKDYEDEFREHLAEYISEGRILLAHYGETRGSNRFRDCDIVVLGGILHKGEDTYIEKARAIYENQNETLDDLSATRYGKVRRFNSARIEVVKAMDMLVDYSQEIKRSSQRDNSRNVEGKVYIVHNDQIFLDSIAHKFLGCQIKQWHPVNLIKQDVTRASNTTNQTPAMEYILKHLEEGATEIYYLDIGKHLNRDSNAVSKVMNKPRMKKFVAGLGLTEQKDGRQMKLVKS